MWKLMTDRIYLYHDYNETVFDASGKLLFNIENMSDPVSVDEDGIHVCNAGAKAD